MERLRGVLLLLVVFLCGACRAKKVVPEIEPVVPPMIEIVTEPLSAYKPWHTPLGDSIRHEMRAVWLTLVAGLDWPHTKADSPEGIRRQQADLDLILDRLVTDGYNTVFFQARQSGSVNYYSHEPFSQYFTTSGNAPGYDPLAYAVEACHKRGLKVHAWLVTYPLLSNKENPHPIILQHPQWAIRHMNTYHLDPGLPEVRSYIASLASDIVRRYDVDGIHFDYFRYPEKANRFRDNRSYTRFGGELTKAEWRRRNLIAQLQEVRDSLALVRQDVQVSVAPLGKLSKLPSLGLPHGWTAYDDVHQDVEAWARMGLVDFVAPMMYYKDHLYEPFLIDWQERVGRYIPIVVGLAPYRVDRSERSPWMPEVIKEQIAIARKHGASGLSMFREAHVSYRIPQIRKDIQEAFRTTALYPELARGKGSPALQPHNLNYTLRDNSLVLRWTMPALHKGESYRVWSVMTYADGTQKAQLLKQGLTREEITLKLPILTKGEHLTFGVEAVNRFGVATPCDKGVTLYF